MKAIYGIFKIIRALLFLIIAISFILGYYFYNKNEKYIYKNLEKDQIQQQDPVLTDYTIIDVLHNNNNNNNNNNDNINNKNYNESYIIPDNTPVKQNNKIDNNNNNINNFEDNFRNFKSQNTNTLKSRTEIKMYYTLQVGSFKNFSKAYNLKKYFISKKIISFIVIRKFNNIYFYRVNVGIFKTKKDAENFYKLNEKLLSRYKPIIFFYSK